MYNVTYHCSAKNTDCFIQNFFLGYTDLRLWFSQFEFLEIIVENDISLGYISKENCIPDYIMCKKNGRFWIRFLSATKMIDFEYDIIFGYIWFKITKKCSLGEAILNLDSLKGYIRYLLECIFLKFVICILNGSVANF